MTYESRNIWCSARCTYYVTTQQLAFGHATQGSTIELEPRRGDGVAYLSWADKIDQATTYEEYLVVTTCIIVHDGFKYIWRFHFCLYFFCISFIITYLLLLLLSSSTRSRRFLSAPVFFWTSHGHTYVSSFLLPGTCLYFLSRRRFGIPTASRFSSNV